MELLHSLGVDLHLVALQIIGFVVLVFLLNRLLYKPLFGVLSQRQADIKATYDQLDDDRRRMEETRRQYEQRLAGIEAEAREKIQAAVKEAQALRDQIVDDARRQAETLLEQGRAENERERQRAFAEMRHQIVGLAIGAAGKVVGETLDAQRHARLVDDFIGSVGAGAVTDAGRGVSGNSIGEAGRGLPA